MPSLSFRTRPIGFPFARTQFRPDRTQGAPAEQRSPRGTGTPPLARGAVMLAAVLMLAACADGPATPDATRTAPPAPAEIPGFGPAAEIARDIDVPWGLAFLPDGAALVAERDTGRILRIEPGRTPEEVYRVPGVAARGEGGLLGLAVSPRYPDDGYVYAYLTTADDNRIVRFRLDGPADPIFTGIANASFHNGGRLAFGPDGLLYVGTGDAGEPDLAQDPASPNGKILRLTPDGAPAPGNPTPGSPVYSRGHRNVQGLAWDSTGRLFAAEFGQNRYDEINLITPGADYGWPEVEGAGGSADGYTDPLLTWTTDEASPSGIAIADRTLYAAALRGERLWTATLTGATLTDDRAVLDGTYGRLRTVTLAPDGALWLTTSNTDGRGDVRSGDDRILRFPAQ